MSVTYYRIISNKGARISRLDNLEKVIELCKRRKFVWFLVKHVKEEILYDSRDDLTYDRT